ncbi:MAG: matrixin family metalloprotease [Pseudomonadota bacterium]
MTYELIGWKWGDLTLGTDSGTIRYSIKLNGISFNGTKTSEAELEDAIVAAFRRWEDVAGVSFRSTNDRSKADLKINVKELSGATLAEAQITYFDIAPIGDPESSKITFDSDRRWSPDGKGGEDLYATALHEIGHVLGLEHVDDVDQIMHPVLFGDELGDGDIAGMQVLYGTPQLVWSGSVSDNAYNRKEALRDLQLDGRAGADRLIGGEGDDTIRGGGGGDLLRGTKGNDTLKGNRGKDVLKGGAGEDIVFGGKGDDKLLGGTGDDVLRGGKGSDVLEGNEGADTFVFDGLHGDRADRIRDFEDGDLIGLDATVFASLGATVDASKFETGVAATSATTRLFYDDAKRKLYYDEDGSGSAKALVLARLGEDYALSSDDFVIL